MMKPAGFRKTGKTFTKGHPGYQEHYNIQGSAWNDPERPSTFYVNCAISFPDVPVLAPGAGLWKYHAHARIGHLVSEAAREYEVTEDTMGEIVGMVAAHINACSDYFSRRCDTLRESYLNRNYEGGFPRDPERTKANKAWVATGDSAHG